MKNIGYDRILNVINYCYNDIRLLEDAFIMESCGYDISNKKLIEIGDEVINRIIEYDLSKIGKVNDLAVIKELLWIPAKSFDLLEFIECSCDNLELVFSDNNVKIDIFKSIIGSIYVDSNYNYDIVRNSFYSMFDINISLLNEVKSNNYIYYIRYYTYESYLDDYAEEYSSNKEKCELKLEMDGSIIGYGNSIFESRYYACKNMYERLINLGCIKL